MALVALNLVLAGWCVGAGVVASMAWTGDPVALREANSRWTLDPSRGSLEVESRTGPVVLRTAWDGQRWVMSEGSGTPGANSRR